MLLKLKLLVRKANGLAIGYWLLALAIGYLAIFTNMAYAQEAQEEEMTAQKSVELEEIVVTGTRIEKSAFDTPNALSVVTSREISRRMPFSTIDALYDEAGIIAQRTTNGQGSPKIRSFTGYHTLILIDGVRLNNTTFRSGPNQYFNTLNIDDIDRIEVVRGPMSVLYGNSALGGVVHAMSPMPRQFGNKLEFHPRLFGRWGSSGNNWASGLAFDGGWQGLDFRANFTRKGIGDVEPGKGRDVHVKGRKFILSSNDEEASIPKKIKSASGKEYEVTKIYDSEAPTDYTENAGSASLGWHLNDSQTLKLAYQGLKQEDPSRWDKLASEEEFSIFQFSPQERHLVYGNYRASKPISGVDSLSTTLSYHRQIEGQTQLAVKKDPAKDTVQLKDTVHTLGLSLLASSSVGEKQRFTYGAEFYHDSIASQQTRPAKTNWGRYPDGSTAYDVNFFLQDDFNLTQALNAIAGVNFTTYSITSDFSARDKSFGVLEKKGSAPTGSLAVGYELIEGVKMHGGVGRGFRAPSLDDLSAVKVTNAGIQAPSPDVDPETSLNVEVGMKMRQPRFGGSLTFFNSTLKDQMVMRNVKEVYGANLPPLYVDLQKAHPKLDILVLDNLDESVVRGIEADLYVSPLVSWTLFGSGTFSRGKVLKLDGRKPNPAKPWESRIRGEPPLSGTLGIRWEPSAQNRWIEIFSRGAVKQNRLSAGDISDPRIPGLTRKPEEVKFDQDGKAVDAGTPGWLTLNVRSGIALFEKRTQLTLAVENIFDRRYREHHSGVDAPGRNFIVSLDNRF